MRTVFSKLKEYYGDRQVKYRLKLRANVHLRLNRSRKLFFALCDNLKRKCRLRKLSIRAKEFLNSRLRDKSWLGFRRNVERLVESRKMGFKAICFFKHSNLYRVFLNWKLLPSFNTELQVKRGLAETQYLKNLKKRIFGLLGFAKICSQEGYQKKLEMLQKTK